MKVSGKVEKPGVFDDDFISHLSSSQKLGKLEANRLEIQWKKICDQEKRSKQRNRELLKDFERVEQHAAMLAVKTERLKTYKQQYENYINKMYPRWREDLENYKLSQQPSRNGQTRNTSDAPLLRPLSSSRTAVLEPRQISNRHLSSTPAHPSSSVPFNMGPVNNRSPPESHYPEHLHTSRAQGLHGDFSYHERYSDFSHIHGGDFPQSARYSQQTDSRWKAPSFYDSQRQFNGLERPYQGQFASNGRAPDNLYQSSPEQYFTSSHRQSYEGQQPPREFPGNFPPDARSMHPELSRGQLQGVRPAAPYEPRTELQKSFLGHGVRRGPYDQSGLGERYYDGRPSGNYGDQRVAGFEPRSMESNANGRDGAFVDKEFVSGFPTRPVMENGHAASQDAHHLHPGNQPFVPPEKPLETNIPTSSFPEPSLSSTVLESSEEGNSVRRNDMQDRVSVTPSTSQNTPPKAVVEDREVGKPEKDYALQPQSLANERAEMAVKTRELELEPAESAGITAISAKSAGISEDGPRERLGIEPEEADTRDVKDEVRVQPALQESSELKDAELSEEEESLGDLSDLSLPDGNEHYVPSALQNEYRRDSKHAEEEKFNDAREKQEVLSGPSEPDVVPDTAKSITEDISEDIPESVALDESEDNNEPPVQDNTLPNNAETASKPEDVLGAMSGVDKREMDSNEVLHEGDREKDSNELLSKDETAIPAQVNEEEQKKPSVGVDGFLALLQVVDADVEVSFSPEALYRSPRCSSDMHEEIVRAAEVGSGLQSFDPSTVSMIVLEELPLLVSSSLAGCLIPDRVFLEGASCPSEKELRPYVETSLIKLWKSLFFHLLNVVANGVMKAEEVGDTFGPLLITQHSRHGKESQLLLRRILEAAKSDVSGPSVSPPPEDDLDLEPRFETEAPYKDDVSVASDGSSSTLGSTPPKVQPVKPSEEDSKPAPDPTASYEDDFEDDVPLTETAAYLKMMSSAHSEPDDDISDILGNSGPQKEESEADDDVERELARSMSPPVTSPRTRSPSHSKSGKAKPKLSLFGRGATTVDDKAQNKDLGDSWGGSSAKSDKSDLSDSESVVTPPLSPDGGFGYVPTALESKDQQTAGYKEDRDNEKSEPKSANDSKAKRKTDFWNNSDTESEVDLQLSTGGFDQDDDDDFDFYG